MAYVHIPNLLENDFWLESREKQNLKPRKKRKRILEQQKIYYHGNQKRLKLLQKKYQNNYRDKRKEYFRNRRDIDLN